MTQSNYYYTNLVISTILTFKETIISNINLKSLMKLVIFINFYNYDIMLTISNYNQTSTLRIPLNWKN